MKNRPKTGNRPLPVHRLFEYVFFHFKRLYRLPDQVEISYGLDGKSRIQIRKESTGFFNTQNIYPEEVAFKEWNAISLPLFFHNSISQDWITTNAQGHIILPYDLIANSFYLLSGWQEFHSPARDGFNRFPYSASVQAKHGFVTKPVVNYYFDILREAIEKAYGVDVPLKKWKNCSFAACLTHDVDYLQSAWKVAGKPALQEGKLGLFLSLVMRKAFAKDAWFNLAEVEKELANLGAKGTFFFLPENKEYAGHPNADYGIASSNIQQEIYRIQKSTHEIGLHGSHGSGSNAKQLQIEKGKIAGNVIGNRFHYLRFDPRKSIAVLEENRLTYDSSLGFPEHFGFRNSFCHPFRLYDFKNKRISPVWELPLNLMDVTLNHPHYLQLSSQEVLPAVTPMLEEIMRFNGVFTLLWHNENFGAYGLPGGPEIFKAIAQYLQKNNACFLTGQEAVAD